MENCIALFVSKRKGFFKEEACINCPAYRYCACDGADTLFDIDEVMRQNLVKAGDQTTTSKPVKVERGLLTGGLIFASLSHKGILAICANENTIQFTDLNNNRQVRIDVEEISLVGFYDDMALLLTWKRALRVARVEDIFGGTNWTQGRYSYNRRFGGSYWANSRPRYYGQTRNPSIKTFRFIKGTGNVFPLTDVSLLHDRRILYYRSTCRNLYSFNVDTRENEEIYIWKKVRSIMSFTGINRNVKVIFETDNKCIYALDMHDKLRIISGREYSFSEEEYRPRYDSWYYEDNGPIYGEDYGRCENDIYSFDLSDFDYLHALVRVYRDIFLKYDADNESWVLIRIMEP